MAPASRVKLIIASCNSPMGTSITLHLEFSSSSGTRTCVNSVPGNERDPSKLLTMVRVFTSLAIARSTASWTRLPALPSPNAIRTRLKITDCSTRCTIANSNQPGAFCSKRHPSNVAPGRVPRGVHGLLLGTSFMYRPLSLETSWASLPQVQNAVHQ
jgi:hypothetical protein